MAQRSHRTQSAPRRSPSTTAPQAARTQAERTDASRAVLIRTTIRLLATEGYRATSVSRIQDASGLSRGLVGYHFGSKLKLMEAVAEEVRANFYDATERDEQRAHRTGLERVQHFFDAYLTRLGRDSTPAKAMLVLATESLADAPELRGAVQRAYAEVREKIADKLRVGVADGSIRADLDPQAHAAVLEGTLRGIVLQHFVEPKGLELAVIRQALLASLEHDLARQDRRTPG